MMDEQSVKLAVKFAEVLGKNSYEWARTKVSQAKERKKSEEQQIIYEEIINSLLQDKMDLEMVAREYKDLYEKVTISDGDIEHLQKTIQYVVQLLKSYIPQIGENKESIDLLVGLINKDTLKTMQLLGFNYNEAIGQPLTEVCSSAIQRSLGGNKGPKNKK
jgi:signal recognition particle GTPase